MEDYLDPRMWRVDDETTRGIWSRMGLFLGI